MKVRMEVALSVARCPDHPEAPVSASQQFKLSGVGARKSNSASGPVVYRCAQCLRTLRTEPEGAFGGAVTFETDHYYIPPDDAEGSSLAFDEDGNEVTADRIPIDRRTE